MLAQGRLEYTNVPFLRNYGAKTFTYLEAAFYPSYHTKVRSLGDFVKNTRLSMGFGIAIPINPMINILIYYNTLNLNSNKKGDIERTNLININLGFF